MSFAASVRGPECYRCTASSGWSRLGASGLFTVCYLYLSLPAIPGDKCCWNEAGDSQGRHCWSQQCRTGVIARAGVSGLSSPCPPRRSLSQGSTNAVVLDVAQTGGHKKRVRRSSFLNAKKLYKDTQMARKVKQYLSNLELEMDEKSLQMLSLQCEPATSTRESPPLPRWLWASCRQQLRGRGAEQELLRLSLSQVRGPCRRTLWAPRAAFSLTTAYPVSSAIWSDCVPLGRCLPWGG